MIRELRARIGDRSVRYFESGSGWPVVLLHAFPLDAAMWRAVLERVPDGWRFIAPDLRGFGPEPAPTEPGRPSTLDDMASDVSGLLDALEIERAAIGGLSMGGYVTFALFRRSPERFTAMILADTKAPADTPDGRAGRRELIERARAGGAAAVASAMLPKLLGATTRSRRPAIETEVRRMVEGKPVAGIVSALEAMMARPDSTADLARIACPALVLVGDEDGVTPRTDAEAMQSRLVRSRLVVLPEAGHLSCLETPSAFSTALADFLASNL